MKNIKTYTDSLNEAEDQEVLDRKLLAAAEKGSTDLVKDLLSSGAQVDATNEDGWTPLHFAAFYDHTDIVRLLLDRGADANAVTSKDRRTPLHCAAVRGNEDTVMQLLDAGADPNAGNINGYTPLHNAALNGHTVTAGLLLDGGADANARDEDEDTPLHNAARGNRLMTAELLLQRGAEVDLEGLDGWTPLSHAAYNKNRDMARLLILNGADPFKAFTSLDEITEFFRGDLDWIPEGPLKTKIRRMKRGKSAFGM